MFLNLPETSMFNFTGVGSVRRVTCWLFACALVARSAAAQDSASVTDSLAERLERAEEAIAALRQQVATQASSGVQSRTGAQLELSGRVLMNAFSNNRRVNNSDVPYFVRNDPVSGRDNDAFGMAIRQTSLALAVTVPGVLGARFSGDAEVDFFGGQQPSGGGRTFPLVRMRTATGALRWTHAELLAGQEVVLISPHNPVSVAMFGFPGFTAAGNLWLWLPQLRGTYERGSNVRLGIQAAVLAPTSGEPAAAFDTEADSAEQSREPFVQGRLRARWGTDQMEGEIGLGAHYGTVMSRDTVGPTSRPLRLRSDAISVDLRIPLTSWLEMRGEAYQGQAVRGLGSGGIAQGVARNARARGVPVRDRAAWLQVNARAASGITVGSGCGFSDPEDEDLPAATGRMENGICEGHLIWRPGPVLVGFEYRRIKTTYSSGAHTNNHLNLAVGFVF
jgi:hypothetical protein